MLVWKKGFYIFFFLQISQKLLVNVSNNYKETAHVELKCEVERLNLINQ